MLMYEATICIVNMYIANHAGSSYTYKIFQIDQMYGFGVLLTLVSLFSYIPYPAMLAIQ